ncbi:hypothetical protein [Streptomyces lunaelactis]|uniref:hypothetical protein n=1 Tax=Streptomyces lunaelactis TaxID=1535768 RepID=UPI001585C08F|nr:hypothetical protein [Streptomyces lunaelactis]NUK22054.1 hypothetical protein [Streptomyces lunaelactis]
MTEKPITPTRIIPAGAPLPARPPAPDELPPWRTPPSPPPSPPAVPPPAPDPGPPPGPIEIRVTLVPAELPPEPSRWSRLWTWITGIAPAWKICAALALAVAPIPGVGYSAATTWAYVVGEARSEFGVPYGYGLAGVPLLLAARTVTRSGSFRALLALAITLTGLTGALNWYDPVTWITGVRP